MGERRLGPGGEFRNDAFGQALPSSTPHWSNESIAQIAP